MKIDLMNVLYTSSMVILFFVAAVVITKTISKYAKKFKDKDEE